MTLVAQITLGGAPFLIGDALISSENIHNPYVKGLVCELPLVGEVNSLLAAAERPFRVDLRQKLHVFEGRLAVGWSSDNELEAVRALKVLRELAARNPNLTIGDVQDEMSAIDPDQIKSLKLVGMILRAVDGNQISVSTFSYGAAVQDVKGFGQVRAAGSGRRTFVEILQQGEPVPTTANDPWTALQVLGPLLNHELSTGQSITERWGGAYETINYSRHSGRLEKLDNVLHTFWVWRDHKHLDFQARFYLTRYFEGLLMIRSAEFETEGPSIKGMKSNQLRLVASALRDVLPDDRAKIGHVEFSPDHICCHVWFRQPGRVEPKGAMILASPKGGDYDIDVSVAEDGSLRLTLPSNTTKNILEAANPQAESLGLLSGTRSEGAQ
jgi:hypothetical protein